MGTSNLPRLTFSTSISFPTPTNSTKALLCVPPRASSQESTLSKHHHKQPKDTSAHPNHPPNPKASRRKVVLTQLLAQLLEIRLQELVLVLLLQEEGVDLGEVELEEVTEVKEAM